MESSSLTRLQRWYLSQCNGDWEHAYGVKIDNLDNPGWSLEVDLTDSTLEGKPFTPVRIQREDEHDWVQCEASKYKFSGYCGPLNLEEVLVIFLSWAESK